MNNDDETLRSILQPRQQSTDGTAPPFDAVFLAAENQLRSTSRKRNLSWAAAAAIAALVFALSPENEDEFIYVDLEELIASTSWTAPSDSLLPHHEFDIYRGLPRLIESTDTDEGALL